MAVVDTVRSLIEPVVAAAGVDLYDVTMDGGKLVVAVTRPDGIDLDTIADLTRRISAVLDAEDPIAGSYTLEVGSPGLERNLRTPEHFAGAIGSEVTVRTRPGVEGERRVKGVLAASDDDGFVVELADGDHRHIAHRDLERARTVFSWGPAPKPGKGGGKANKSSSRPHPPDNPGKKAASS